MPKSTISYHNTQGGVSTLDIDERLYKEAADKKMSVPALLTAKCPDIDLSKGTAWEQAQLSSGLIQGGKELHKMGMSGVSMGQIMADQAIDMAGIRAPDGSNNNISARMLYPQVILETMRDHLVSDHSDFLEGYNRMVALTESVIGARVDQPTIDTRANENVESGQIAQLAEPASLVSITVGDTQHRIPTDSIGLMISDEALDATSLDLVNLAMTAHARGNRIRMVENNIKGMVAGDEDRGMAALGTFTAKSLDNSITNPNEITRKAWIKFLRQGYRTHSINSVMMDLDTALRLDQALLPQNHSDDKRVIQTGFGVENLGIKAPNVLLVDNDVLGAGTIVGLDSAFAIRRMVNVSASYQAIEEFLLRKAKAFRIDHGEQSHRLYDEAWSVMTLTT